MEEMPSLNMSVQRLKGAILPLDLPCSGPVTHWGEILTTGKSHGKKPNRFLASIKRDEITTFPPSAHLMSTLAMRWRCWWVCLSPSFALWEIFLCLTCALSLSLSLSLTHTHTHKHTHTLIMFTTHIGVTRWTVVKYDNSAEVRKYFWDS